MDTTKVSFNLAPTNCPDVPASPAKGPQGDTQPDDSRLMELKQVSRLTAEADRLYCRDMVELESRTRERVQKIRPGGSSTLSRDACFRVERLWVTFRAAALGKGYMECPTIDDVLQFLDAMVQHPASGCTEREKPLLVIIKRIQSPLIKILRFQYFDFESGYGKTGAARAKALLERMVYKGELVKEKLSARKRFASRTTHTIVRCWLYRALTEGCASWNRIWVCLATLLMEKACSVDDGITPARVDVYWKDIQITLQHGELSVRNLKARIAIRYISQKTGIAHYGRILNFHGSLDEGQSYVSIIPVLLVLALRCRQVEQTTIGELLQQTFRRGDRTIQWLHPGSPVLPHVFGPAKIPPAGDSMALTKFERILAKMGLAAGILEERQFRKVRQNTADYINEVNTATQDDQYNNVVTRVQEAIVDKWREEECLAGTAFSSSEPPDSCPIGLGFRMVPDKDTSQMQPIDSDTKINVDGKALKSLKEIILGNDDSAEYAYSDAFIIAGYSNDDAARQHKSEVDQVLMLRADRFVEYFSEINVFVMRNV